MPACVKGEFGALKALSTRRRMPDDTFLTLIEVAALNLAGLTAAMSLAPGVLPTSTESQACGMVDGSDWQERDSIGPFARLRCRPNQNQVVGDFPNRKRR
jgi:hypothetical protein